MTPTNTLIVAKASLIFRRKDRASPAHESRQVGFERAGIVLVQFSAVGDIEEIYAVSLNSNFDGSLRSEDGRIRVKDAILEIDRLLVTLALPDDE